LVVGGFVAGALVVGGAVVGALVAGLLVAGLVVGGFVAGALVVGGAVVGAWLVLGGVWDGVVAEAPPSAPGVVGALELVEGPAEAAPAVFAFESLDPELHADRARIAVTVSARDMRVFFMNWCLSGPNVDVPESCARWTPSGVREAACLV
jgi:hypothetical protein